MGILYRFSRVYGGARDQSTQRLGQRIEQDLEDAFGRREVKDRGFDLSSVNLPPGMRIRVRIEIVQGSD